MKVLEIVDRILMEIETVNSDRWTISIIVMSACIVLIILFADPLAIMIKDIIENREFAQYEQESLNIVNKTKKDFTVCLNKNDIIDSIDEFLED